ncbi:PQ-loop-domain-containing protein [Suhomyces tanzawaensis NRRL Y-17324]|uniref:PQ-loop-domain-containing protein n=1 Tax=Suhomyces tanzawaensis NRRL Y-17324 TaxID=984487 RepID=A0A1E4SIC0_9ASCO|nr:PQ-loop-domain-containing protein [Suhomyces tanzawaensis NRRL Y-17324]ODV79256.1 PQ-loop-domain-containing protein [Suhomyces tanzawaensis NRRL Y-17324]
MPTCGDVSLVSSFFSTLSCASWICAQLPQIVTNYRTKSAHGISPSFLLLWFLGDFLSFTSCLLNDAVLGFQVYLSVFFLCNDITLCFQYYYYNSVYPAKQARYVPVHAEPFPLVFPSSPNAPDAELHATTTTMNIRHHAKDALPQNSLSGSSYNSINDQSSISKAAAIGALMNATVSNAYPTGGLAKRGDPKESLGLVLAWGCTVVYMSSRCPQLYKNYLRKSVEGISPILFGAALMGNLTYTLSILTSCEFLSEDSKSDFFMKELPYILGSSGTIVFDMLYFYQKYLYRNSGSQAAIAMRDWDVERRESNESDFLI